MNKNEHSSRRKQENDGQGSDHGRYLYGNIFCHFLYMCNDRNDTCYPVLIALIAGIPCVLFFTKVQKFGMITIMAVLTAVLLFLMGYGYPGIFTGLAFGLIADFIMKSGNYKSFAKMVIGYVIFSEWVIGTQLPMFIMGNAYAEQFREMQGDEFVDGLEKLISWGMCAVVAVCVAVAAIVGVFLGKAVLNKHFERAGIV